MTTATREITTEPATAVRANSHALTPTMTPATTTEGRGWCRLRLFYRGLIRACALGLLLSVFGGGRGARSGKLETGSGALLLSNLGGLLGIGQGQGVTSLMSAP